MQNMLDEDLIAKDVAHALAEDVGSGDITAALLPENESGKASIITREPMVIAGIPWVTQVFKVVNPSITLDWQVTDGAEVELAVTLAYVSGPIVSILTAERTALNFLQTLSGVATQTRHYVDCLKGTDTQLLDTRKTLPGLRYALKYAVRCGGGMNHRMGLYDAVLIKENHIKACGSIEHAIRTARQQNQGEFIEVEVETIDEFKAAHNALPDRILLDNFTENMLEEAVKLNQNQVKLEASGGVSLSNINAIARTGVDFISVGEITKSVRAIDLSLLLEGSL